jgi:hypothetical protein
MRKQCRKARKTSVVPMALDVRAVHVPPAEAGGYRNIAANAAEPLRESMVEE